MADPLLTVMEQAAGDDTTYSHAELMITLVAFAIWAADAKPTFTYDDALTIVQRFMAEST